MLHGASSLATHPAQFVELVPFNDQAAEREVGFGKNARYVRAASLVKHGDKQ